VSGGDEFLGLLIRDGYDFLGNVSENVCARY
jgi:hypothetical protein